MKKWTALILVLTLVLTVAVAAHAEGGEAYNWSMSTTYATGSPMVEAGELFAQKLAEYSNGAIKLNVFPDSVLYGEGDAFMALASDELEFIICGAPVSYYTPEYSYLIAPFIFKNAEEYLACYESEPIKKAREIWRTEYNTHDLGGVIPRGWRNLSSSKAIYSASDLKGIKLRLPGNSVWLDAWASIGATSVSIPLGELYTALQNGAADASDGPWEQMANNSLWEVQKYIIQTQHIMESTGFWMSESLYQSLSEEYKEIVDKAAKESLEFLGVKAAETDNAYLQQMLDGGCELIQPDVDSFIELAQSFFAEYFTTVWTGTTYDELMEAIGRN